MPIHAPYDSSNIFAKILRGEAPCAKVLDDEVALAFMDIFPQSRGHTLVIPKGVEARNLIDCPADVVAPLMERVQKVARAVVAALSPDGVAVIQRNGAAAGQTVFHLHFNIVPVYDGEAARPHASGKMADPAELAELAARIAAEIR